MGHYHFLTTRSDNEFRIMLNEFQISLKNFFSQSKRFNFFVYLLLVGFYVQIVVDKIKKFFVKIKIWNLLLDQVNDTYLFCALTGWTPSEGPSSSSRLASRLTGAALWNVFPMVFVYPPMGQWVWKNIWNNIKLKSNFT